MFRIQLSRLVQDLLNFGVLHSLWLWGGGRWVGGCLEAPRGMGQCPYTCAHAHACTRTHACTCIHEQKLQMAANMEASMFIMFSMHVGVWVHVYMHVHICACVHSGWVTPHTNTPSPQSTHLPHPQGGTRGISQNSIALELIEVIQFCLKI